MASTIGFDISNHQAVLQNNITNANGGIIITAEDKKRREKIPKRATLINTCLFVPWFVYTAVLGNSFGIDLETRMFLIPLSNAVANAVRNPLIGRLAFHVNRQIIRQTVEDRRKCEIEEALKKRNQEKQRKTQKQQMKQENQSTNPEQDSITINQYVNVKPLLRQRSMPNIEVKSDSNICTYVPCTYSVVITL